MLEAESRLGVVFSFIGDSRRNPFIINPASGMVSLDQVVDFEEVQSYNFTVLASSMVSGKGFLYVSYSYVTFCFRK